MAKNRKPCTQETPVPRPDPSAAAGAEVADPERLQPSAAAPSPVAAAAPPAGRLRRLLPDLIKAALACAVVGLGTAIWIKPPLIRADFPRVTYRFDGETRSDAHLFRPLAMPTRFYIQLPRELAGRYDWFAVDRRREVAALAEAPRHRFLGLRAIKRSDPLGLDLEFRKLDHSEWQVHFLDDAILFSNAVLAVRLDANSHNNNRPK